MDYLSTLRNVRRILFIGFLVNVVIVTVCWLFVLTNLMTYFMWTMPGWDLRAINDFVLILISLLHIASITLFLIPTVALSIEIACKKKGKVKVI